MADVEKEKVSPATGPQATVKEETSMSGRAGGAFNIEGKGFGYEKGTLVMNDRHVESTRWNDVSIKGQLPFDMKPGKMEVKSVTGKVLATAFWKGN